MTKRTFDDGFWGDTFVQGLEKDAKILFAYLWTNRNCNSAGLYEITPKTIAFETGIAEGDLPHLFEVLTTRVKWLPEYNVVWVKNFLKHQAQSPFFLKGVATSISHISANGLITEFLDYNQKLGIKIPLQYPLETVSGGSTDPPNTDIYTDNNKNPRGEPTNDISNDSRQRTSHNVEEAEPLGKGQKLAQVFACLDEERGYRPPKREAEAASIRRMLKAYSPSQIVGAYKRLKAETFWQDKELYMMSVETQIGAIIKGGSNGADKPDAKRIGQRPQSDSGQDGGSKYVSGKYGQFVQH